MKRIKEYKCNRNISKRMNEAKWKVQGKKTLGR